MDEVQSLPPDSPCHKFRAKRGRDGLKRVQVTVNLPEGDQVTAAGVLLWSDDESEGPTALMLKERGVLLGDVGGKVEPEDVVRGNPHATLCATVRREFREETGGQELNELRDDELVWRVQSHSRYALAHVLIPRQRLDKYVSAGAQDVFVSVRVDPNSPVELSRAATKLGRILHPRLRP